MNKKKRKQLKDQLKALTRAQLVALGKQKTETPYSDLLDADKETLVDYLLTVDGILKPVAA